MRFLVAGVLCLLALSAAAPAAADPPTSASFEETFPDVNPCTGDPMMVTIRIAIFEHSHGSRVVGRGERTITTDDGSVGRGTESFVDNGQIVKYNFTDIMTNALGGYRFRAAGGFVFHIATDTLRVDRFEFDCLGPA